MKRMGGDKLGMTDTEMMDIVRKWRKANPKIVALWEEMQECAFEAVRYQRPVTGSVRNLVFDCNGDYMTIQLPAGRKLFYCRPHFKDVSPSGRVSKTLYYEGLDQKTKQWLSTDLYGGKITENIVQAIARDLIGYAMLQLENNGYGITMHVHDEAIAEIPADGHEQEYYNNMVKLMSTPPDWAADLPLNADGYITPFYKKD
jgi:DNA polymerase